MNKITKETRKESYLDILDNLGERQQQCLNRLKELGGKASANDLARYLYSKNVIPFYNTNYTNPRLNELAFLGIVKVVAKQKDSFSGKNVAIYSVTLH